MNKLGVHVLGTLYRDDILEIAPKAAVMVLLDDAISLACEVKRHSPGTLIVARRWFADQSVTEPEATAGRIFQAVMEKVRLVRECVDFVVGYNEPVGDWPTLDRYLETEKYLADMVRRSGLKLAAVNFSRGFPDLRYWERDFVRQAIREIVSGGNVLGLHEYGQGSMENQAEWLSLRHRKVIQKLGFVVPVLITETGIDGGGQGQGWRTTGFGKTLEEKAQNYERSLIWYADRLREDSYVRGAAIFTIGPGWDTFDILHEFKPHLLRVLEYTPKRPKGDCPSSVAEYIDDRLEQNPDPSIRFPERSLEDVQYIAIHHTTGGCNVTPEGIARWHVRHNGWAGIGYHFLIACDGKVWQVGDLDTQRANVYGRNREVIGVAFIGTYDDHPPTPEAMQAARKLIACLWRKLGRKVPVEGHKDLALPGHGTNCPGRLWPSWKKNIMPEGGDGGMKTIDEYLKAVEEKAAKLGYSVHFVKPDAPGKDGYVWVPVDVDEMTDGSTCVPVSTEPLPPGADEVFSVQVRQWWKGAPQTGCDGCASCWHKGEGASWTVGVPGHTRRLCYGQDGYATECKEDWVIRWWMCDPDHPSVLACFGMMKPNTPHHLLGHRWKLVKWTDGDEGSGGSGGGEGGGDVNPPSDECDSPCAECIARILDAIFGRK